MDNASNNNTLIVEIEELKKNPHNPVLATSTDPINQSMLQAYAKTLERDPVGQCHAIAVIQEGNENGFWRGKLPDGKTTLSTRWSSTFKMVDRVLMLNPAIQSFLLKTQNADISDFSMDAKDTDVLRDIHQIIEVPHVVQELLSSEWTPTLSMALPAYQVLNSQWTQLRSMILELSHYIDVGLDKLKQYITEGRKTRIYALSMIVNPSIKLEWLKEHWEAEDVKNAREWMLQAVHHFFSKVTTDDSRRDQGPTGTIHTLSITITAGPHKLDSNCLMVPISWIWPHEQPESECAALVFYY
ncbi:hypothetical protein BDR07DRAFT_1382860 [Suillus spraguei]|nr:hypothetical protein BDR07DRAFT_1382860 [Suillus spraguei]